VMIGGGGRQDPSDRRVPEAMSIQGGAQWLWCEVTPHQIGQFRASTHALKFVMLRAEWSWKAPGLKGVSTS
jgi:hypothetical protein